MPALAVVTGTEPEPGERRFPLAAAVGLGAVLSVAGFAIGTSPAIGVALVAAAAFAGSPRFCRWVLLAVVLVGPTVNPPVLGIGAGRLYVVQALVLAVGLGGLAAAMRSKLRPRAVALISAIALLAVVETVGRENAGLAWVYRPLQIFFVAFAVRALFRRADDRPLLLALGWGAVVGCTAAAIHALVPAIDPFVVSRPDDLPFVSAIGSFARATGAFTYPNNLGTFAAYAVLFGAAGWLLDRPALGRGLSAALMGSGALALLLAGSRAAGLGMVVGLLYLTVRAAPTRRIPIIAGEALIGLAVVFLVLRSPTASEVVAQRVESATQESLVGRLEVWQETFATFVDSPLIGTGSSELNVDNFVLLYASQGGLVGLVLLALIAALALGARGRGRYRELSVALGLAFGISGMLQDSLGQTLVTWFLGALLGVAALPRRAPSSGEAGAGDARPVELAPVSAAPSGEGEPSLQPMGAS